MAETDHAQRSVLDDRHERPVQPPHPTTVVLAILSVSRRQTTQGERGAPVVGRVPLDAGSRGPDQAPRSERTASVSSPSKPRTLSGGASSCSTTLAATSAGEPAFSVRVEDRDGSIDERLHYGGMTGSPSLSGMSARYPGTVRPDSLAPRPPRRPPAGARTRWPPVEQRPVAVEAALTPTRGDTAWERTRAA
jgi:hypothetical protein